MTIGLSLTKSCEGLALRTLGLCHGVAILFDLLVVHPKTGARAAVCCRPEARRA